MQSVNLQLTSNPAISSTCISNSHLRLTNFMLINTHHEMVTLCDNYYWSLPVCLCNLRNFTVQWPVCVGCEETAY
jgi:hypothetical protein